MVAVSHWTDFRARTRPIDAVLPGVVLYAGNSGDWAGNHVAIRSCRWQDHHVLAHVIDGGSTPARSCMPVTVIGYVGETGAAFGPAPALRALPGLASSTATSTRRSIRNSRWRRSE